MNSNGLSYLYFLIGSANKIHSFLKDHLTHSSATVKASSQMGSSGNKRCGILSGIFGSLVTLGIGIVIGLYAIGESIVR